MRDQGIAGHRSAPIPAGSVVGLGICDVWRLELTAAQLPWLVDEIDELRRPLEEALDRVRSEYAVGPHDASAEEVSAREYELRLRTTMRRQLPPGGNGAWVVFAGPSELVRIRVRGTVRESSRCWSTCSTPSGPVTPVAASGAPRSPMPRGPGCRRTSTATKSRRSASIRRWTRCRCGSQRQAPTAAHGSCGGCLRKRERGQVGGRTRTSDLLVATHAQRVAGDAARTVTSLGRRLLCSTRRRRARSGRRIVPSRFPEPLLLDCGAPVRLHPATLQPNVNQRTERMERRLLGQAQRHVQAQRRRRDDPDWLVDEGREIRREAYLP